MNDLIHGGCLCGQVRFSLRGPFDAFHQCHCSRCRKATGAAHAANVFSTPDRLNWLSGADSIRRFELPAAERFARCFCAACGSPLPCVSRDGSRLLIPAGCLDEDPGIRPQDHIFWRDRAPWYEPGVTAQRFAAYPE